MTVLSGVMFDQRDPNTFQVWRNRAGGSIRTNDPALLDAVARGCLFGLTIGEPVCTWHVLHLVTGKPCSCAPCRAAIAAAETAEPDVA